MGIDNFHSWLKTEYTDCFVPCDSQNIYDYIYIDVNHLLHHSMNGSSTEEQFIEKLYASLDLLFCNFLATKKVIIAIDGTSPYSKILLQRKRRLMGINKLDMSKLSSIQLTPGTELTKKINVHLKNYIDKMEQKYLYLDVKFEYISSFVPDEGEIKIFKKMIEYGSDDNYKTHLVVGNDADLIVLAVSVKNIQNINILIRHQKATELLSVNRLIDKFCKKISNPIVSKNTMRSDFAIISLMLGNDYLPKLKFIKYESIWKSYFETKAQLITNNIFNKEVLMDFTSNLINNIIRKKFNPETYDKHMVINYLEGLLWCLDMYETGECSMYDYTYNYKSAPTPADINYYLSNDWTSDIQIPRSNTLPISHDVFTLLVMPKKAINLVPEKYHKYINNELKNLYELEECDNCISLKNKMSILHKQLKKKTDESALELTKEKIGKVNKEYHEHKKTHMNEFTVTDISKILQIASV
jgi:hypothetical protein